MRFGILGPLRVGGGEATVTAGRDRTVLAMLLLRAGRVVSVDELVDAVWEESPPATARAQLQICVSRLRQRLARLGLSSASIVTDPVGYGIRVDPAELDAEVFARAVEAGRAAVAAGQPTEARRHYRAALALWRGPALSGIASRPVRRRAQALDEQRIAALEECVDVELRLHQAADLIDELAESVDRHPLRERLRGQLMLALSAVGRQADALAVYREGRRIYAEELGIEPGAALQELHQRVLAGDLALAGPANVRAAPVRCLPRAISDFTGRQETLARLIKEIADERARVQLIDGMAGSGKTTLAIHLATALAERYPDAQLFIDLHGHSEREPVPLAAALAALLRQLGVPGERIPADVDERAALWRSELADRRALVVLDNAASAAQVAPLLPSGRDTLTLITSRRRLVGLDEGRPSSLAVLEPGEGIELLARVVGAERVAAEPEAAAEVVRRCGQLPLAIRLAGARLAHRPRWRIADLAARLADGRDVLTELVAGDRSVGQAFTLSYAQVTPAAQRMFRLLGLHPGTQFDGWAAAALADAPLPEAEDLLEELVDAHLAEEVDQRRFRFHDLVRDYARQLMADPAFAVERSAALDRMFNVHLHLVTAASRQLNRSASPAPLPRIPVLRPDLGAEVPPVEWLDENRANLIAMIRLAEQTGRDVYCWQLAHAGWSYWFAYGHLDELIETHTIGLRAAERLGDDAAVATMHNYLASGYYRLARYGDALASMEIALSLRSRLGDRVGQAGTHKNIAAVHSIHGNVPAALRHLAEALDILRSEGHDVGVVALFTNQAGALLLSGRLAEALAVSRMHLMLARTLGTLYDTANAMGHIAMARARMGHGEPALRRLRAALAIKRRLGNRYGVGELLNEIGAVERASGHPETAMDLHHEALVVMTEAGDRNGQCASRNLLARALLDQGDVTSALDLHRRVLVDATKLDARYEQARALDGIARCLRGPDPGAARAHWIRALELFREFEAPERHEVEQLLAELG
ncbi:tetratricopeptide repeat protein [Micromonospora sp. DR5-3]|uniref:AfsR/SARP family transcriptional regulator n=1 Tax=unclassified Micromonospora TaxID=2617518 RepID=UPI0011D83B05|nr:MULTISPECIES: BTAD domain-containing putative transcriptional regulator [unclassified Micromonospora]MCW3813059.1 tetratricopeptide repeat protein [Micromonospora sp. DR5-3]TYC26367.1 tetratricopeptide repeat protein [Micromonospora sp. MP36]